MMTRRELGRELGRGAAGAAMIGMAGTAQAARIVPASPLQGRWTGGGDIVRAGGRLHYARLGKAKAGQPPVVLLHKLGGWIADWRETAALLGRGREVIAFDLPGHGESVWQGHPPYAQSTLKTAALLAGALTEMGIDRVDLVGTSLGGCIAVALAAAAPERVRRLAVMSSVLGAAKTAAQVRAAIDVGEQGFYTPQGAPLPLETALSVKAFGLVHGEKINVEQNASRKRAGQWIRPSQRGVALTDFTRLMPRIDAPTLLLYGARDKSFIAYREGAEAALKTVRTVFVPDAGAFAQQDNPAASARLLSDFLQTPR